MSYTGVGATSGNIYYSTSDNLRARFSPLVGDVTGGIHTTRVSGIAGISVFQGTPNTNDVIAYNGSIWAFSAPTAAAHNLLSATHSDTLAGTVVRGDLVAGNSTPAWAKLPKGPTGSLLYSNGTDIGYLPPGPHVPFLLGTIAAPSIAFSGDLNTGISAANPDIMYLSAGGSGLLSLDGVNNTVRCEAGVIWGQRRVTTTATLTASDHIVVISGSAFAITLPAAPVIGRHYVIKDGFGLITLPTAVTIVGNGTTIDGNATIQMVAAYASVDLIHNGQQWNIV